MLYLKTELPRGFLKLQVMVVAEISKLVLSVHTFYILSIIGFFALQNNFGSVLLVL